MDKYFRFSVYFPFGYFFSWRTFKFKAFRYRPFFSNLFMRNEKNNMVLDKMHNIYIHTIPLFARPYTVFLAEILLPQDTEFAGRHGAKNTRPG